MPRRVVLGAVGLAAMAVAFAAAPPSTRPVGVATPRPVGANVRLMEQLADAGLVTRLSRHRAAVDPWNTTVVKGASYIPSTARNQLAHWVDYNGTLARRELGFGAAAGMNVVRVSLHWAAHAAGATTFLAAVDDFVVAAAALRLGVVFAVFEGPGADVGAGALDLIASGAYRTTGWLANPGYSAQGNASLAQALDAYRDALLLRYARDARVVGWDVVYQPILCASQPGCTTPAFLTRHVAAVAAAVDPAVAWVTTSIIPGAAACDAANVPPSGRSLVAFENYNGNRGAVGGDTIGVQACAASLGGSAPLPVLLTGSMDRRGEPPSSLCEILFEAYGTAYMDIPAHPRIGVIVPNLVAGVNEFSSGAGGGQGLVWPNGTWVSAEERACFAAAVPPVPPPPPPPPPPGLNFTTRDGLVVGLRSTTRAVQFLGIAPDDRWFRNFSFVPPLWNWLPEKPHRDFDRCHHVGDATLRVQPASSTNASDWAFYTTATGAAAERLPLPPSRPDVLDVANLTATVAADGGVDTRFPLGLHVVRSVERAPSGGVGFAIRLNVSVPPWAADGVRIGGLGFSLISDSFFGNNNNTAIAAFGSFLDAHVGLDGGFATMTRADGSRQLLVTPCSGDTGGAAAHLEAWRPILEDAEPPNEGMWEWTVHSAAWAPEWARNAQAPGALAFPSDDPRFAKAWPAPRSPWPSWHLAETVVAPNPRPWNPPTARTLAPGEAASYALCFSLPAPVASPGTDPSEGGGGPRARDAGLAAAGRAVVITVPGAVLAGGGMDAALFVRPPSGAALAAASSDDPGVLGVGAPAPAPGGGYIRVPLSPAPGGAGRARVTLSFTDGTLASAHLFVLPPLVDVIAAYGAHGAAARWLPRAAADPFGRSASFMPWDREDGVRVLQDARPFVVGLSDDAGAGATLGMAAKLASAPHAAQLALLDEYVNATLLGVKPDTATPPLFSLQDPQTWRVLMTVWYFDKEPLNATGYYEESLKCTIAPSWCAFNSPWCNPQWCAGNPDNGWSPASYRQYNFPHQIAVYLSLYLAARNLPSLPRARPADFYLNAAVQSLYAANCRRPDGGFDCVISVGLMDGTVFREVLRALLAEGAAWAADAAVIEGLMRTRTAAWNTDDNPAGSEFAWDTTGQEEVGVWGAYFNATDAGWMHGELNARTVDSILGFTQALPTWAHSGASYGMGDFSNNAKWMVTGGWEREGGHYRSGLNSIPVLERYRAHPDDFTLLLVGTAGNMAPLPNIDADGAPSMAFHTHPFIMAHDPNSGDHGLGLFGHALNAGAYVHAHADLGLLCFSCAVGAGATPRNFTVEPCDGFRARAYLEPVGLWLVAEAGRLARVALDLDARTVTLTLESGDDAARAAGTATPPYAALRVRVEAAAPGSRPFSFAWSSPAAQRVRGAFEFAPAADPAAPTVAVITFV